MDEWMSPTDGQQTSDCHRVLRSSKPGTRPWLDGHSKLASWRPSTPPPECNIGERRSAGAYLISRAPIANRSAQRNQRTKANKSSGFPDGKMHDRLTETFGGSGLGDLGVPHRRGTGPLDSFQVVGERHQCCCPVFDSRQIYGCWKRDVEATGCKMASGPSAETISRPNLEEGGSLSRFFSLVTTSGILENMSLGTEYLA
jgi:hypothetical protein